MKLSVLIFFCVFCTTSFANKVIELKCNPNFDVQSIVFLPYRCINGLSCFFENIVVDNGTNLVINFDEANYGLDCIGFYNSNMSILPNNLFNKYKAVNSLYASGMDLQKLPAETFLNASNMLDMNLSYNKLEKLEEKVFTPCEHLKKLVLNNNQIAEIDVDAFDKLYNLEELDLSHNKLTFVPHKALAQLSKLKTLKLTNNTFVVRYGQFPDTLVTLDLSYNDLESFSLKSIISLTKLKYLFLNGNKIFRFRQHIFPDGIFDVLKSLKYIQLSDNGFFCTTLADIFIWLEKYKVKVDVVPHLMILNSSNIHGVGCKEETRQLL